jgi:tyrosine-protein phosphatase SIW14
MLSSSSSVRIVRSALGLIVALAVPAVPVAYASHRLTTCRHFHIVEDGRLYRSGQLTPKVLDEVIREQGIKTIVCLRSLAREGDTRLENEEELWCADRDIGYVRLNPIEWDSPKLNDNLAAFLRVVDDPKKQPVLVHCFAGLHRTGVYCAVFRMERHGWSNDEAIAEMYAIGYFKEDPAALKFLREYRPAK